MKDVKDKFFREDKFICCVRYMIQAAENKRCVPYHELSNIIGLSRDQVGYYAGRLGDFCKQMKWPLLNGLIISSTDCVPSEGFGWYKKKHKKSWETIITECWKHFHVQSSKARQVKNFSGIDKDIHSWFNNEANEA